MALRIPARLVPFAVAAGIFAATSARSQAPAGPLAPVGSPTRTWGGRWIWLRDDPVPRNSLVCFRKTFELDAVPRDARLFLAADTRYRAWLNGVALGRGPTGQFPGSPLYDTRDVTTVVRRGANTLAVLVQYEGDDPAGLPSGRGGLLAEITTSSGRTLLRTDATWKARRNGAWKGTDLPRMGPGLGFPAWVDARAEPLRWNVPDTPDQDWEAATEVGPAGVAPWAALSAGDTPRARLETVAGVRVLDAQELTASGPAARVPADAMAAAVASPARRVTVRDRPRLIDGVETPEERGVWLQTPAGAGVSLIVDFGRTLIGYPQFRVRGAKGGEVLDLGYAEALQDSEGRLLPPAEGRAGALIPTRDGRKLADRYICRAGEQFHQSFERRAFRFVRLDVWDAPAGLDVSGFSVAAPADPREAVGTFRCADEQLNRIWELGAATARLCAASGAAAEPLRDPYPWPTDARVLSRVTDVTLGDPAVRRRAVRAGARLIGPDGRLRALLPGDRDRVGVASLHWVAFLHDTYTETGDAALVRELYPQVRAVLERGFPVPANGAGLLAATPFRLFAAESVGTAAGRTFVLNAFYYEALHAAAALGDVVRDPAADAFRRRAEAVRSSLQAQHWDAQAGRFRTRGEAPSVEDPVANALVELLDLAPPREARHQLAPLLGDGQRPAAHLLPGAACFPLQAMSRRGAGASVLKWIRAQWGPMDAWGSSTCWERWEPSEGLCAAASAAPSWLLSDLLLGVRPLKPGYAEIVVAPDWGGLPMASGSVSTIRGPVQVAWQQDGRSRTAAVRIVSPDGIPVEIELRKAETVLINGKDRAPEGLVSVAGAMGRIRFRAEKGGAFLFELQKLNE